MKKTMILLGILLSTSVSIASETSKPVYNVPEILRAILPGAFESLSAFTGKGTIDGAGPYTCTILSVPNDYLELSARRGVSFDFYLIINNKAVGAIHLEENLKDFFRNRDAELEISYDKNNPSTFGLMTSTGYPTNQFIGYNEYHWDFTKTSPNSFSVNYKYHWADDDGGSGTKVYKCDFN
jgi:hypothetical protein